MVEGASLKKGRSDRYQETWSKGRYDLCRWKNEKRLWCYFVHNKILPSKINKKTTPATGLIDSGNKTPSERKQHPHWVFDGAISESNLRVFFSFSEKNTGQPAGQIWRFACGLCDVHYISSNVLINSQQLNLLYSSSNWKRSIKSQANPVAR